MKKPKALPVGISANDSNILKKVIRRAYHLDMLFNVPILGYRIGWSGIVGVIPVAGDIMSIFFSLLLFKLTLGVDGGLPYDVQAKMLGNILIDFLIGLIPIVGDLVEIMYKANSRNALLLEKHLKEKADRLNPKGRLESLDDISITSADESLYDTTFDESSIPLKAPSKPQGLGGAEESPILKERAKASLNNPEVGQFRSRTFSKWTKSVYSIE